MYSGGCDEHRFELFGTAAFALSMPPQGYVYLCHDARGDSCETQVDEKLTFDLSPLKAAWRETHHYTGMVRIRVYEAGASEPAATVSTDIG